MVFNYIELIPKNPKAKYRLDRESFREDDGTFSALVSIRKKNASCLDVPEGVFGFREGASSYPICDKFKIDLESEDWEIRPSDRGYIEARIESLNNALKEIREA